MRFRFPQLTRDSHRLSIWLFHVHSPNNYFTSPYSRIPPTSGFPFFLFSLSSPVNYTIIVRFVVTKTILIIRIGPNELIGCTAIGSTLIGVGREHWLEMLDNPRKPVAQWYPLNKSPPTNVALPIEVQPVSLSCLNSR